MDGFDNVLVADPTTHRYDAAVSGPSGNVTIDGSLTYGAGGQSSVNSPSGESTKHASASPGSVPSYAIHNGECFLTSPLGCHLIAFDL